MENENMKKINTIYIVVIVIVVLCICGGIIFAVVNKDKKEDKPVSTTTTTKEENKDESVLKETNKIILNDLYKMSYYSYFKFESGNINSWPNQLKIDLLSNYLFDDENDKSITNYSGDEIVKLSKELFGKDFTFKFEDLYDLYGENLDDNFNCKKGKKCAKSLIYDAKKNKFDLSGDEDEYIGEDFMYFGKPVYAKAHNVTQDGDTYKIDYKVLFAIDDVFSTPVEFDKYIDEDRACDYRLFFFDANYNVIDVKYVGEEKYLDDEDEEEEFEEEEDIPEEVLYAVNEQVVNDKYDKISTVTFEFKKEDNKMVFIGTTINK